MLELVEKITPAEHKELKKSIKKYKAEIDAKRKDGTLTFSDHYTLSFMVAMDAMLDKKFKINK